MKNETMDLKNAILELGGDGIKMTYEQARSFVKNNPSQVFTGWNEGNERPHRFKLCVSTGQWRVESLSTEEEIEKAREVCFERLKAHVNECLTRRWQIDARVIRLFNAIVRNPSITRSQLVSYSGIPLVDTFHPMVWE
jgi:hypothetical protein